MGRVSVKGAAGEKQKPALLGARESMRAFMGPCADGSEMLWVPITGGMESRPRVGGLS